VTSSSVDAADPLAGPVDGDALTGELAVEGTHPEAAVADVDVDVPMLTEPRDGLPAVIDDALGLHAAAKSLANGHGPVAVDAERASGYRYGQRAYLVQLRREGAGIFLIDPAACPDLSIIDTALADAEWIVHAASQDLTCLAEVGLVPRAGLFDTEHAGRLLNRPRVGLAALVEAELGVRLAKEHSAVDWSTRPLPEPWLRYAALDVELLIELRDKLAIALQDSGKHEWAAQEFAAIAAAPPSPPRVDPWRRVSGLNRVRSRRGLALIRQMWLARDALARERDIAAGRVLTDAAIIEACQAAPTSIDALGALATFRGRGARRHLAHWWAALEAGYAIPENQWPPHTLPHEGPPAPRAWPDRNPDAAARLAAARAVIAEVGERVNVPAENLLTPDLLRRTAWSPPASIAPESVLTALSAGGARPWQCDLLAEPLCGALLATAPEPAATELDVDDSASDADALPTS
jgi:ribonuclease D